MTIKQCFILAVLGFYIVVPESWCMDTKQLHQNFTPEESVLHTLSIFCPETLRGAALDLLWKHPGFSCRELLDFYTVQQGAQRLLGKAMLPMVKAIWKEIEIIRLESLKNAMYEKNCIFRTFPKELVQAIEAFKNSRNQSAVRKLIIIDSELNNEGPIEKEARSRLKIYNNIIAPRLGLERAFYRICEFPWDADRFEPHIVVDLRHEHDCPLCTSFMQSPQFIEGLDKIIKDDHFVIITTFDPEIINLFKNKDGLMVVNIEKQTPKDRLITLQVLAAKRNCPDAIKRNLELINQIIPQTTRGDDGEEPLSFGSLDWILSNAERIFLTDEKFDADKAREYFEKNEIMCIYRPYDPKITII